MGVIRAIGEQWQKSQLSQGLILSFSSHDEICELFCGATSMVTVTNVISALVFDDGLPCWLLLTEEDAEAPLSEKQILRCLFHSLRLLFIRALAQQEGLAQTEQLIVSVANDWCQRWEDRFVIDEQDTKLCGLISVISMQLNDIEKDQRLKLRSMGQ